MNIKRVKYRMSKDDKTKMGYVIGEFDGFGKTLLDENFNYVPKIREEDGEEYLAYDMEDDLDKRLNIAIDI